MSNPKLLWAIIVLLLLALAGFTYKFVSGSVAPSDDGRTSVVLNKDERNLILDEMRAFLISVQAVSQAITEGDRDTIIREATRAGMAAEANTPGAIFRKIPLAMKQLGFDTRGRFDQIAEAARQGADMKTLRVQLDSLLNNCIACHASFRLPEPAG